MLQHFTLENFLSFKNKEELKLCPSRGTRMKEHRVEPVKGFTVLKTAAMFGANAGGKSNFIKAIDLCKRLILLGTPSETPIEYYPFRLDSDSKNQDTKFVFQILYEGRKYEYGFSYNAERISKEWLKLIKKNSEHSIFYRDSLTGQFDLKYLMSINPKEEERQFLNFFAKATHPRQLFLHEVINRNLRDNVSNIEDLISVIDWFANTLKVLFPNTPYKQGGVLKAITNEQLKEVLEKLLRFFDTGIEGIDLSEVDFNKVEMNLELRQIIKSDLSKSNDNELFGTLSLDNNLYLISSHSGDIKAQKLQTLHKRIDDNGFEQFSLKDESDGTKRIFDYIPLILDLIQGEKVFIIDEMERSLHPSLMRKLLDLFYKYSSGESTQLIFSTHESTLMDQELLRRDEIWLTEKTKEGISSLSRLDEKFNLRFDKELEKAYLKGLFGAVSKFESDNVITQLIVRMRNEV